MAPSTPPPALVALIAGFLSANGYTKAAKSVEKQAKDQGLTLTSDSEQSLTDIYNSWAKTQSAPAEAKDDDDSSSASESESSSDSDSDSDSDDSSSDEKEAEQTSSRKRKAASPASSAASSSSADSDADSESGSSSDSDSDSDSESESEAAAPPAKKSKKAHKKSPSPAPSSAASSSASGSDSDDSSSSASSGSDDGSDSDADSDSAASSSESSDSDDSSSSSDSDSSDSDSESESDSKPAKKSKKDTKTVKKAKVQVKAEPVSTPSSATLSEDSAEEKPKEMLLVPKQAEAADAHMHPDRKRKLPASFQGNESAAPTMEAIPATDANVKRLKKENVPFSRIPEDQYVDPRLSSNAYIPYDYANRAHEALIVTKGKDFTKAKNKGKRGSYRGGKIDMAPKGIKFDD